jgi:hypothetical protein
MEALKPKGKRMNALQKKFLLVAATGVATWVFIQSPSAQTIGTDQAAAAQAAMEQAVKEMGVQSNSSAAAHDKVDAAMTGPPAALPSEAERKAIAAMSK